VSDGDDRHERSGGDQSKRARLAPAVGERAVQEGATLEMPPQDQFYGERSGCIRDPFGHRWNIGHGIEEVAPEEMQRRYTALLKSA
jgi:hypothetical protein